MKKDAVKIKSAAEWQGTDRYAGIDSYEKIELKAGTQVCALVSYDSQGKMKPCEYLFPKEQLDQAGNDATQLSEKLQVRPFIDSKEKNGSYRSEVAMFELKRDLVVEGGRIAENTAYGEGGLTQYYLPASKFSNYLEDGTLKRSKFGESSEVLLLDHSSLPENKCKEVLSKQKQLLLRRNLFCHQKAKLDTMDIIQNSPHASDVVKATENLEKLNGHIHKIKKKLSESVKSIGRISSPLYDSLNKELNAEIKYREMHPNSLLLSNVKIKSEENRTSQEVFDKNNINVVLSGDKNNKEAVAENLFKKMEDYNPNKEWNDIDVRAQALSDVMNINRMNSDAKERMLSAELRPRDYTQVDVIALQGSNAKITECKLSDHFTNDSVQKIRNAKNGNLSVSLEMKDGQKAKIHLQGNSAQLFLYKDKLELQQQVGKMPLDDSSKKNLLSGGVVMGGQGFMQIDRELNAIVPASPAQPLMGQTQHVAKAIHRHLPKKRGLSF